MHAHTLTDRLFPPKTFALAATLCAAVALSGCGEDEAPAEPAGMDADMEGMEPEMDDMMASSPPTASLTAPSPVAAGDAITLDAGDSSDPDGDTLTYTWSIENTPQGSQVSLASAMGETADVTLDAPGEYQVRVEVSDGSDTASATADISALGEPVADAGADLETEVDEVVTLDGTGSSSPTGVMLAYQWSIVTSPDPSDPTLSSTASPTTEFRPDAEGTYIVELRVSHAVGEATDRVTIEVAPEGGRLTSTVYVSSSSGDDDNRGTQEQPVATLDAALQIYDSVMMVDRIELEAGTYDLGGTVETIVRDLDIAGPSAMGEEAVIMGDADLFEVESGAFLTLLDVTVETDAEAFGVSDTSSLSLINVTCEASTCIRSGGLFGDPGGTIEVQDSTLTGTANASSGIVAAGADSITLRGTTIEEFDTAGAVLADTPLTVRDATVQNNGTALRLVINESVNATEIANSTFVANTEALSVEGSENVTLRGSTIGGSTGDSIVINGGALIVRDTDIENGDARGILVQGAGVLTMRDSDIEGHTDSGVRVEGEGARVDLGTMSEEANSYIVANGTAAVYDARPASATGQITLHGTSLGVTRDLAFPPPADTYSGPNFNNFSMIIENATSITTY